MSFSQKLKFLIINGDLIENSDPTTRKPLFWDPGGLKCKNSYLNFDQELVLN